MKWRHFSYDETEGFILPTVLSFIIVAIILSAAVMEVIDTNFSAVNNNVQRQQAFNIAEAGINQHRRHQILI
jgi:Tfp pilus assembly protein PilX